MQITSNNIKVSKAGEEINLYNYLLEPSDLGTFQALLPEQETKTFEFPSVLVKQEFLKCVIANCS